MQPNTKVVATPTKFQSNATNNTENALITALTIITVIPIGALLWIVLASGQNMGDVAPAAITAISGMVLAAISAITVAIRKRRNRTGRS